MVSSPSAIYSQVKLGQTGFQFLSVVSDARAGALGGAMTTVAMGSSSLFFNPANMARSDYLIDVSASYNSWIADIQHTAFSVAYYPKGGRYGVIGLSYASVNYGEFQGTMVWNNEKGYTDTETFYPTANVVGVGYARRISDRFCIGGQLKYANQYLGRSVIPVKEGDSYVKKNLANGFAYDFGTVYRTEFRGLTFGMSVRDFSGEIKYEKESFQLPLMFRIGVSMEAFQFLGLNLDSQELLISCDAVHPRSYPEFMNLGAEYSLFDRKLYVRGGYIINRDLEDFTFGFGVAAFGTTFDYSFTGYDIFNPVQRFTIRVKY